MFESILLKFVKNQSICIYDEASSSYNQKAEM